MESQSVDQIYNNVLHPRLHVVVKVASIMASERICAAVSRECQIQGQVGIYLAMRFSGLLMVISFSASLSYSPMQRCAFHSCSSSLSLYTYTFPLYYILICIRKSMHMDSPPAVRTRYFLSRDYSRISTGVPSRSFLLIIPYKKPPAQKSQTVAHFVVSYR